MFLTETKIILDFVVFIYELKSLSMCFFNFISGRLFHIDFGYILGRDPKPLPPPMKLSKEMVEAMGGTNSDHFNDFKILCYTAFLHLRR